MGKATRKTLFVVANGKKAGDEDLRDGILKLRDEGHDVQVRVTWEPSDVERYVAEALENGADTIVAAGGDGTVNQIAGSKALLFIGFPGALVKLDAPEETRFAVIPMGTANDFATGLDIPEDPYDALQLAAEDTASPIDIGRVNDEVFINVATGGFGAEITEQTDTGLKDAIGGASYILTGLTKPHTVCAKDATARLPLDALVLQEDEWVPLTEMEHPDIVAAKEGDGKHAEIKGKLLVLAVGNARQAGGGVQLCPDAKVDDGLLDVSYMINLPIAQIPKVLSGMQDDKKLEGPIGRMRCSWLEVDCPDELQINRDGEPMRSKKYSFKIMPHRLMLHMPKTDLLSHGGNDKHSPRNRVAMVTEKRQQQRQGFKPQQVLFHPVTKAVAKSAVLVGIGCGIGMKFQQRRMMMKF